MAEEFEQRLKSVETELANIKGQLGLGSLPTKAIRVPTYAPQTVSDELANLIERQKDLIEALRETVPQFGLAFDKLRTDREKRFQDSLIHNAEALVWGKEEE